MFCMVDLRKIKDEGLAYRVNQIARSQSGTESGITFWSQNYHEPRSTSEAAEAARATLRADPAALEKVASHYEKKHSEEMIKEVEKDPKKVYENTSEQYVIHVVDQHIGNREYKNLRDALKTGNGVSQAFRKMYDDDSILADIIAVASLDAINTGAQNAYARARNNAFIKEKIIDKKNGKFSMSDAAKYAVKEVKKLKDKDRDDAYKEVGIQYTAMNVSNEEKRYFQQQ